MPILGPSLKVLTSFPFRVISFEPLERFLQFFYTGPKGRAGRGRQGELEGGEGPFNYANLTG